MPQVISIKTFYASKRTSFFTFLNVLPYCTRRINSSTNFGLRIKQPEF